MGKDEVRDRGARRSGRPSGSLKLTPDGIRFLIAAIESGASDHAAARAGGIDPRTFRTYRQVAEGRHPTRKPTRDLVELFRKIDEAAARARIRREMAVADKFPKDWLRYQAPSEPGLPGWTARVPDEQKEQQAPIYEPSPEELGEIFRILVESGAIANPFVKKGTDDQEED